MSYAHVNGLSLHYHEHGDCQRQEEPLIMLHGGFGTGDTLGPEFYALLGGGLHDANWDGSMRPAARLAILPGRVHTDMLTAPGLAGAVSAFLDAAVLIPPPQG